MRFAPVLYFAWLVYRQLAADWPVLTEPRLDAETILSLSALAYLGLLVSSYWRKPPARAERHDWLALAATLAGMDALGLSAAQPVTQPALAQASVALSSVGTLLAIWSAVHLGKSFSLLPQARELVTTGPYRHVRHPMYSAGLLMTVGEILSRFSLFVVAVNIVFVVAQLVRLRLEERLLEKAFPGYVEYRARTAALAPGIV